MAIRPETRTEIGIYFENIAILLLGIALLAFPLVFTQLTTDPFVLPKQILLGTTTLLALLLLGAKMVAEGKVKLRKTPFDLPLFLWIVVVFISALAAVNRTDAIIAFVPYLFIVLAYFLIVNLVKQTSSIMFLLVCFVAGAGLTSLLGILSFLKIYILPLAYTKTQLFTPLGSLLDQALYLAFAIPLAGYFVIPFFKNARHMKFTAMTAVFLAGFVLSIIGFLVTVYEMVALQRPLILPFESGFRIAFAAISQDAGRVLQGFLFGSGYGEFITSFTRFKPVTLNADATLWSLTFIRSTSFVLELLATTGVLGVVAFIFLLVKIIKNTGAQTLKENAAYLSLMIAFVGSFILPYSFIAQALLLILFGLFTAIQGVRRPHNFFDIELYFAALKKGLINVAEVGERISEKSYTKFMPVTVFIFTVVFIGVLGFFVVRFVASDIIFAQSLVAASKNQGLETYNLEVNAIKIFPYRDAYYRIYSQTNLALANSLASSQPQGQQPSQEVQQTIFTLIQQSINAGRTATSISPLTSFNWENLASIYRALIGFGQNAEDFAAASYQQAIVLDPQNPQNYINLGGIFYQLGQWDNAQRQFQIAINLKSDFANAYYNSGHAFEQKGDPQSLQNALVQYQTVKNLVANDKASSDKIQAEIDALQQKIGTTANAQGQQGVAQAAGDQQPIGINQPATQLPERKPEIEIPPPPTASGSSIGATPTPANRQ